MKHKAVLVAAAVASIFLGGCSAPADEPAEAPVPRAPAEDARARLLDVADLPTGGWVAEQSGPEQTETSKDKADLGPCMLDLASSMTELVSEDAERQFTREGTSSFLMTAIYLDDSALASVATFRRVMEPCVGPYDGTRSGQPVRVVTEPLEAPTDTHADEIACRRFETSQKYTPFYGHMCFVAVSDALVGVSSLSRYSPIEDDEFFAILSAAAEKAAKS